MYVYIITTTEGDFGEPSPIPPLILQVMDTPRGAFEAMREYAAEIDATIEERTPTLWHLTERDGGRTHTIESIRKPVMSFNQVRPYPPTLSSEEAPTRGRRPHNAPNRE